MKKMIFVLLSVLLIAACISQNEQYTAPSGKSIRIDNVIRIEYYPMDTQSGVAMLFTQTGVHRFAPVYDLHLDYGTVYVSYNGHYTLKNTP